jgi:hypothetical protein
LTTIENERVILLQLFDIAITVKMLTIGIFDGVVAEKAGISPVPDVETIPMAELV